MSSSVRLKLSIMMFLQYAVWGAWAVSMGGYLGGLGFTGAQIGAIYATTAIAAMISPISIGYLADRLFATEKMIAVLHLIGAALLGIAAVTTDFETLRGLMVAYALCYMPTLALTNSISFANIGDPERDFPGIRVFGTWGWIVAGWVVGFVLGRVDVQSSLPAVMATGNAPVFLAAGLSGLLGLFSFTLPHTPPRAGQPQTGAPQTGVLQLLKDPSFLVFTLSSFLICIPLSFYYGFANLFLTEIDAPYPTALQTLGQLSEVGFMAAMPFFIKRLGVKKMLAVGMLAWVARYMAFGTLQFPLVVFGLFLHGVCYDFFFVASQIYVDNRVSPEQRASAQSFLAFITMGVGMFIGSYVGGLIVDQYPPTVTVAATITDTKDGTSESKNLLLPNWDPTGKTGLAAALKLDADGKLSPSQIPDEYVETDVKANTKVVYLKENLSAAASRADRDGDGVITRPEWRKAQERQWREIWNWPAIMAAVTCLIFLVGFRAPAPAAPASVQE